MREVPNHPSPSKAVGEDADVGGSALKESKRMTQLKSRAVDDSEAGRKGMGQGRGAQGPQK